MTSINVTKTQDLLVYTSTSSPEEEVKQLERLVDSIFKDVYPDFGKCREECIRVLSGYNQRDLFEHQTELRKLSVTLKHHLASYTLRMIQEIFTKHQADKWRVVKFVSEMMDVKSRVPFDVTDTLQCIEKSDIDTAETTLSYALLLLKLSNSPYTRNVILNKLVQLPRDKAEAICKSILQYVTKVTHGYVLTSMVDKLSALSVEEIEQVTKGIKTSSKGCKTIDCTFFNELVNLQLGNKEEVVEAALPFYKNSKSSIERLSILKEIGKLSPEQREAARRALPLCTRISIASIKVELITVGEYLTDSMTTKLLRLLSKDIPRREDELSLTAYMLKKGCDLDEIAFRFKVLRVFSSSSHEKACSIPREAFVEFSKYSIEIASDAHPAFHYHNELIEAMITFWQRGELERLQEWISPLKGLKESKSIATFFSIISRHPEICFNRVFNLIQQKESCQAVNFQVNECSKRGYDDFLDYMGHLETTTCGFKVYQALRYLPPSLRKPFMDLKIHVEIDETPIFNVFKVMSKCSSETKEEFRDFLMNFLDECCESSLDLFQIFAGMKTHMSALGLVEQHPLYQKAAEMEVMHANQEGMNHPATVYKFHKENSGVDVELNEKKYTYGKYELILNEKLFRDQPIPVVTKSMLPKGVDHTTLTALEKRGVTFTGSERLKAILRLIPEKGEVPTIAYALAASLHYLKTLKDDTFDTQLMLFSHLVDECSTGVEEGIVTFYNDALPRELKIHESKAQTSSEKRGEKRVKEALLGANRAIISELNPLTRHLSEDEFTEEDNQVVHITKYIKNLIGAELGIEKRGVVVYDVWTGVLHDTLLKLSKKELLSLFYDYCTPEYYVNKVQHEINRDLREAEKVSSDLLDKLHRREIKRAEYDKKKPTLRGDLVNFMNQENIFDEDLLQISKEGALKLILKTSLYRSA